MAGPRRRDHDFDPARYARELDAIFAEVGAARQLDGPGLDRILKRHPKDGRGLFSRSELLAGLRARPPRGVDAQALAGRLVRRPVRTLSGVTPVTVLTKPFPCPGRCIFCPDDVRMPKSYLAAEPGCQRAEDNGFDPYLQTWNRLAAYRATGHPVDKVELIVLGGTWSAYPEPYRIGFTQRCLEALNDFGAGVDRRAEAGPLPAPPRRIEAVECGRWEELAEVQRANEVSRCRNVGLAFETRPDHVTPDELVCLRRLGATKVQIGIQSLSDAVLAANRRGHDVAATRRALVRLRGAGFKIHAHWMPNLLGATPESDLEDFAGLFADPALRPDELKLYPCLLAPGAPLAEQHARGAWRPYADEELLELVARCLPRVPRWCRVTRVVRDFSAADIHAGTHRANLREEAERRLRQRGERLLEIRSREVRGQRLRSEGLRLRETAYATGVGEEHFLEWVTGEDRIAGFLRLSLPREPSPLPELRRSALIREVHVYGAALELGRHHEERAQHRGLGTRLVERAVALAREAGSPVLSVISAVGTRPWYRRLGFEDGDLYQHRPLGPARAGLGGPQSKEMTR